MGKAIMKVSRSEQARFHEEYCCGGCWNPLGVSFSNDLAEDECLIDCGTDDCNLPGLVSAKYVEKRLSQSQQEAYEVKEVLRQSEEFGWLKPVKRSASQSLSELGF
jgi:hypothetical protein